MTLHREGFIPLSLVLVVSALIIAVLYCLNVPEIAMWIVGSCSAIVFILLAQFLATSWEWIGGQTLGP